jgi:translation initiation factor 5A
MDKKMSTIKQQKPGSFILIEDVPYKVENIQLSKPGKHGAAKAKVTATTIFGNGKKIIVQPADARIDIPVIEKKDAQVLSFSGENAQIMDLEDYSTSEVEVPQEFKDQLKEGDEILIWKFGSYVMIKGKK